MENQAVTSSKLKPHALKLLLQLESFAAPKDFQAWLRSLPLPEVAMNCIRHEG